MHDERALIGLAVGFLLVLTRMSAFFAFIPIPGSKAFVDTPKILLTVVVALMLFRFWPAPPSGSGWAMSTLITAIGAEVMLGVALGVGVALIVEAMQLSAQFLALQAGFS